MPSVVVWLVLLICWFLFWIDFVVSLFVCLMVGWLNTCFGWMCYCWFRCNLLIVLLLLVILFVVVGGLFVLLDLPFC